MSALAPFVLGVLVGAFLLWLIFSVYWRRWRGYLTRDMGHLQAKVKSVEATNMGLERQLTAQKTDLAGMRSKINTLETENRLTQARVQGVEAEKQALTEHLNTLRAELAAYKSKAAESGLVQMPAVQRTNGHVQQSPVTHVNGSAKSNGVDHTEKKPRKKDPARDTLPPEYLSALSALLQDVSAVPASLAAVPFSSAGALYTSVARKNGNGSAAKAPHTNGKSLPELPPDQQVMPEIHIARPRMGGDRLEIIQGVGPAVMKKLDQAGIDSFRALAALSPERLKEIIGPRLARLVDVNSIIDQAKKIKGSNA